MLKPSAKESRCDEAEIANDSSIQKDRERNVNVEWPKDERNENRMDEYGNHKTVATVRTKLNL